MGPSFRGAPRTRAVACACLGAIALIAFVACTRDQATSPLVSQPVPGERASYTVTTLGTSNIPIPGTNWPGDGAQPVTNTGIIVPAGSYYRVRVKGTVTVATNPVHAATFSGFNYTLNGTYGPGGIGSYSQLLVLLRGRNTDGSGSFSISMVDPGYGTSAPDSAASQILLASKEIEIQAGRNGIGCVSNNNVGSGSIGCYALPASQTATVERYTNFVHVTATPSAVRSGQQVTFQATSDEAGLVSYGWVWTRDPGTNANPANGCNSWVTLCTAQIYGSGTMTANTNYGTASAHVTVYTSFTLDAVPSTVVAGASVTFTPRLDGSATPAARWRWVPSASAGVNTAPCPSGVSTCTRAVMSTGTMWAYLASTPGVGDSASALVTVTSDSTSVGNGATCPSGALCANATLHVIRGSGVTGSQIPADGSVYPINSVVGYSFGPDAGYREIALVVDDTGRATTGIITMDHDHTIEIEADSDYMLNPDIASISARLLSLVHASDPPSAYSEFLNWYRNEGVARGFDDLDRAIDVADYMTFDVGRDSVMLNAFDEALGGVVFQVLRAGNSTTFEFMRPGDYAPVGITSRRRAQGAALSLTPASGRPSITYINGMNTTRTTFETSASKFASLVTAASLSSVADAWFLYNPTFQEELRAWGDACAARAQRDLLHTARLIVALHWAACARVPFGKWLLAHDTPEAILQLYQTRFRFAGPKPQFVTYLGNYMSNLHRLGDATIFVTHSQGNMMVSQALANLSAFEATQGACVAELTLASPIGRTHFKVNGVQLNDAFLDGVSVRGDVLQLLVPDTDNDFTPFIDTDISMQAEQAFQTITGVFELERARWDWGIRIHEVNHNYFDYSSSRTVLIHKLQNLYDNCQTAWSR